MKRFKLSEIVKHNKQYMTSREVRERMVEHYCESWTICPGIDVDIDRDGIKRILMDQ
jgi:hypothetical protein